jgi:hypothetical protein
MATENQDTASAASQPEAQTAQLSPIDVQLITKLEKLSELKTGGILSDAEFQEQKCKLIYRS